MWFCFQARNKQGKCGSDLDLKLPPALVSLPITQLNRSAQRRDLKTEMTPLTVSDVKISLLVFVTLPLFNIQEFYTCHLQIRWEGRLYVTRASTGWTPQSWYCAEKKPLSLLHYHLIIIIFTLNPDHHQPHDFIMEKWLQELTHRLGGRPGALPQIFLHGQHLGVGKMWTLTSTSTPTSTSKSTSTL